MSENDLIIGPEEGNEEETGEEVDAAFEWDTTSESDYVNMALSAFTILDSIELEKEKDAFVRRINQMKKWALKIAWHNLKSIYDLTFETPEEE